MTAASQSSAAIGHGRHGAAAIGHGRRGGGGYVREALALACRLEPIDRALALSSKLFVAVIPLIITVSALVPGTDSFGSSLVRGFHLSGAGARATQALFATDRKTLGAAGLLGIVIVLYSVLSYARGLQRLYLDAWGLAPLGAEAWWRRALWSGGYTTYLALWALLQTLGHHAWLAVTYAPLVVALSVAVAFWGPWALIGSQIPWPRLVPTAALTAVADAVFKALSLLLVPPAFTAAAHRYGLIGIAFALLSWLFLEALVSIMAAIVTITRDRRRHGPAITPGQADSDRWCFGSPVIPVSPPTRLFSSRPAVDSLNGGLPLGHRDTVAVLMRSVSRVSRRPTKEREDGRAWSDCEQPTRPPTPYAHAGRA